MSTQNDVRLLAAMERVKELQSALRELVARVDGAEGMRADGSNMDTTRAHAVLGDLKAKLCPHDCEIGYCDDCNRAAA